MHGTISRSENMARIRSRGTAPERTLRRILRHGGLRPTSHPDLPGTPDVGFVRKRLAVFVDGCFWHGCPQHYIAPRTHRVFWERKLRDNIDRDAAVDTALQMRGFRVLHLWQHELGASDQVLERVLTSLSDEKSWPSVPRFGEGKVWWACWCGSVDVQVTALSGPGSLKPAGKSRPASASLRCRTCHREWDRAVPEVMV